MIHPTYVKEFIFLGYVFDHGFESVVNRNTHGSGVDLILNCTNGESLQSQSTPIFKCLRNNGRYVEIYTVDNVFMLESDSKIFVKNYTCHRVLPDALFSLSGKEKLDLVQFIKEGK